MHIYVRDEQVSLRMEAVDAQGLVPADSELVPMAFYAEANLHPSFRALLPPETVEVLRDALQHPVTLGVLAEEPKTPEEEVHAMVGLAVPIDQSEAPDAEGEEGAEPWRSSAGSSEAWRGENELDFEEPNPPARTALLAFAPLVRLQRRFPADFGEELADLLERALSGSTRPALQARVDRMLGEL